MARRKNGNDEGGPRRSSRAKMAWLLALGPALIGLAACRQILGLETDPPLQTTGAGGSAGAGGAGGNASGGSGGAPPTSPFTVINSNPSGDVLYAIWGAPSGFFVAVGESTVSYVRETGGSISRIGGQTPGRDYLSVWGTSASDVYAVGKSSGGGFIAHYDGQAWTQVMDTPGVPLFAVWGTTTGKRELYAAGANGSLLRSFDGLTWKLHAKFPKGPNDPPSTDAPLLLSMAGRTVQDWGLAAETRMIHFEPDAGGYAFYEPHGLSGTFFRCAWQAPLPTTALYFGTNFHGLTFFSADASKGYPLAVIARDESTPQADQAFTRGVWGTASKVAFVGDEGRISIYDTATQKVSQVVSPTTDTLYGIWGKALDDVWIVGPRELILHGSLQ